MAENKDNQEQAPIIIVKRIKKGGHGYHGGAWKVAYADFVTAMMAFFLLMWLLNASDEETRRGISNYFSPIGTTNSGEGSGGLFGGLTIQSEGALVDTAAQPSAGPNFGLAENSPKEGQEIKSANEMDKSKKNEKSDFEKAQEKREKDLFKEIEEELRESIAAIPELSKLGENLIIDETPEGLRIQLVDKNKVSMFPNASDLMEDHTFKLLEQVGHFLKRTSKKIAIYGHTDGKPYKNNFNYGNWELSSDRAHASRRVLVDIGVDENRIHKVVGKAAQEPLIKNDPLSPQNRRISIVLMREHGNKIDL